MFVEGKIEDDDEIGVYCDRKKSPPLVIAKNKPVTLIIHLIFFAFFMQVHDVIDKRVCLKEASSASFVRLCRKGTVAVLDGYNFICSFI